MTSGRLVPLCLWDSPPPHSITSMCITTNGLVTGSDTGEMVAWSVNRSLGPGSTVPHSQPTPWTGNSSHPYETISKGYNETQGLRLTLTPTILMIRDGSAPITSLVRVIDKGVEYVYAATTEGFITKWAASGSHAVLSRHAVSFVPLHMTVYYPPDYNTSSSSSLPSSSSTSTSSFTSSSTSAHVGSMAPSTPPSESSYGYIRVPRSLTSTSSLTSSLSLMGLPPDQPYILVSGHTTHVVILNARTLRVAISIPHKLPLTTHCLSSSASDITANPHTTTSSTSSTSSSSSTSTNSTSTSSTVPLSRENSHALLRREPSLADPISTTSSVGVPLSSTTSLSHHPTKPVHPHAKARNGWAHVPGERGDDAMQFPIYRERYLITLCENLISTWDLDVELGFVHPPNASSSSSITTNTSNTTTTTNNNPNNTNNPSSSSSSLSTVTSSLLGVPSTTSTPTKRENTTSTTHQGEIPRSKTPQPSPTSGGTAKNAFTFTSPPTTAPSSSSSSSSVDSSSRRHRTPSVLSSFRLVKPPVMPVGIAVSRDGQRLLVIFPQEAAILNIAQCKREVSIPMPDHPSAGTTFTPFTPNPSHSSMSPSQTTQTSQNHSLLISGLPQPATSSISATLPSTHSSIYPTITWAGGSFMEDGSRIALFTAHGLVHIFDITGGSHHHHHHHHNHNHHHHSHHNHYQSNNNGTRRRPTLDPSLPSPAHPTHRPPSTGCDSPPIPHPSGSTSTSSGVSSTPSPAAHRTLKYRHTFIGRLSCSLLHSTDSSRSTNSTHSLLLPPVFMTQQSALTHTHSAHSSLLPLSMTLHPPPPTSLPPGILPPTPFALHPEDAARVAQVGRRISSSLAVPIAMLIAGPLILAGTRDGLVGLWEIPSASTLTPYATSLNASHGLSSSSSSSVTTTSSSLSSTSASSSSSAGVWLFEPDHIATIQSAFESTCDAPSLPPASTRKKTSSTISKDKGPSAVDRTGGSSSSDAVPRPGSSGEVLKLFPREGTTISRTIGRLPRKSRKTAVEPVTEDKVKKTNNKEEAKDMSTNELTDALSSLHTNQTTNSSQPVNKSPSPLSIHSTACETALQIVTLTDYLTCATILVKAYPSGRLVFHDIAVNTPPVIVYHPYCTSSDMRPYVLDMIPINSIESVSGYCTLLALFSDYSVIMYSILTHAHGVGAPVVPAHTPTISIDAFYPPPASEVDSIQWLSPYASSPLASLPAASHDPHTKAFLSGLYWRVQQDLPPALRTLGLSHIASAAAVAVTGSGDEAHAAQSMNQYTTDDKNSRKSISMPSASLHHLPTPDRGLFGFLPPIRATSKTVASASYTPPQPFPVDSLCPGDIFVLACVDGSLQVCSLRDRAVVHTLRGHDSVVTAVHRDAWCISNGYICTQTALGSVYIWRLVTGSIVRAIPSAYATAPIPTPPFPSSHLSNTQVSTTTAPALGGINSTTSTPWNATTSATPTGAPSSFSWAHLVSPASATPTTTANNGSHSSALPTNVSNVTQGTPSVTLPQVTSLGVAQSALPYTVGYGGTRHALAHQLHAAVLGQTDMSRYLRDSPANHTFSVANPNALEHSLDSDEFALLHMFTLSLSATQKVLKQYRSRLLKQMSLIALAVSKSQYNLTAALQPVTSPSLIAAVASATSAISTATQSVSHLTLGTTTTSNGATSSALAPAPESNTTPYPSSPSLPEHPLAHGPSIPTNALSLSSNTDSSNSPVPSGLGLTSPLPFSPSPSPPPTPPAASLPTTTTTTKTSQSSSAVRIALAPPAQVLSSGNLVPRLSPFSAASASTPLASVSTVSRISKHARVASWTVPAFATEATPTSHTETVPLGINSNTTTTTTNNNNSSSSSSSSGSSSGASTGQSNSSTSSTGAVGSLSFISSRVAAMAEADTVSRSVLHALDVAQQHVQPQYWPLLLQQMYLIFHSGDVGTAHSVSDSLSIDTPMLHLNVFETQQIGLGVTINPGTSSTSPTDPSSLSEPSLVFPPNALISRDVLRAQPLRSCVFHNASHRRHITTLALDVMSLYEDLRDYITCLPQYLDVMPPAHPREIAMEGFIQNAPYTLRALMGMLSMILDWTAPPGASALDTDLGGETSSITGSMRRSPSPDPGNANTGYGMSGTKQPRVTPTGLDPVTELRLAHESLPVMPAVFSTFTSPTVAWNAFAGNGSLFPFAERPSQPHSPNSPVASSHNNASTSPSASINPALLTTAPLCISLDEYISFRMDNPDSWVIPPDAPFRKLKDGIALLRAASIYSALSSKVPPHAQLPPVKLRGVGIPRATLADDLSTVPISLGTDYLIAGAKPTMSSFGIFSDAGQSMSVLFPKASGTLGRWRLDSVFSAVHTVAVSSVLMLLLNTAVAAKRNFAAAVTYYSACLPPLLPVFIEPDVAVVASYLISDRFEVFSVAKACVESFVRRVTADSPERRASLIQYWGNILATIFMSTRDETDSTYHSSPTSLASTHLPSSSNSGSTFSSPSSASSSSAASFISTTALASGVVMGFSAPPSDYKPSPSVTTIPSLPTTPSRRRLDPSGAQGDSSDPNRFPPTHRRVSLFASARRESFSDMDHHTQLAHDVHSTDNTSHSTNEASSTSSSNPAHPAFDAKQSLFLPGHGEAARTAPIPSMSLTTGILAVPTQSFAVPSTSCVPYSPAAAAMYLRQPQPGSLLDLELHEHAIYIHSPSSALLRVLPRGPPSNEEIVAALVLASIEIHSKAPSRPLTSSSPASGNTNNLSNDDAVLHRQGTTSSLASTATHRNPSEMKAPFSLHTLTGSDPASTDIRRQCIVHTLLRTLLYATSSAEAVTDVQQGSALNACINGIASGSVSFPAPIRTRIILAADFLAKGFSLWRVHINIDRLGDIIRRLHYLSYLRQYAAMAGSAQRALLEIGRLFPLKFVQVMGREALSTKNVDGTSLSTPTSTSLTSSSSSSSQDRGTASHLSGPTESRRALALESLAALVKRHHFSLAPVLPTSVHTIVRCLDPSDPAQRKELRTSVTRVLTELVRRYPTVSFHQGTQRLAVAACSVQPQSQRSANTGNSLTASSTTSSTSLDPAAVLQSVGDPKTEVSIFDLRTANKWKVLTDHKSSVTALAFNENGHYLVTYCCDEKPATVRFFTMGEGSFLGSLFSTQGRLTSTHHLPPLARPDAKNLHPLDVKFAWTTQGNHEIVTLTREDHSTVSIKLS